MLRPRTLGWMVNDPARGRVAFHALEGALCAPEGLDGIGVATCVDDAALLTRRPARAASLHELIGAPKGACVLVQLRDESELRPSRGGTANLGPFRMRHIAGAVRGGPVTADEATASRDSLLERTPEFLRRSVEGQSEGEAFFLAVLGVLHESSGLERVPQGPRIVDAVRQVLSLCGDHPRTVVLATGLEVVQVTHRMPSAYLRLEGLPEKRAAALEPALVDTSLGRERLRRFCGGFLLGDVAGSAPGKDILPAGAHLERFEGGSTATVLGRDLKPHFI